MTYQKEFQEALLRNERFGFEIPNFKFETKRYITDDFIAQLPYVIRDTYGELSAEDLVARCIPIHFGLANLISEQLNVPTYFTLGDFSIANKRCYEITEESLKKQLISGVNCFSMKIHAWLTLPSMEIIDFTLATTFDKMFNSGGAGGIVTKHYSELTGEFAYHPMLIGEEYLKNLDFSI